MKRAWLLLAVCLPWVGGCEARCREVEPLSAVRAELHEDIEDRLDDVDATDAQLQQVKAAFAPTLTALQQFRARTLPREHEVMAELRKPAPDRARLGTLIGHNVDAWEDYVRAVVQALVRSNAAMTAAQRQALAERASEPSEPAGTFLLDRAVDYFVMRIEADAEQRALIERIKAELVARGGTLRRQADALRREAFTELAKPKPNLARVDATIDRGGELARRLFLDLAGYYLLLSSKLDPRQRAILNAELVRFEPCPLPAGVPGAGTVAPSDT